jgi:hypothetical protein
MVLVSRIQQGHEGAAIDNDALRHDNERG